MTPIRLVPVRLALVASALAAAACGGGSEDPSGKSPERGGSAEPAETARGRTEAAPELPPEEQMRKSAEETAKALKEMNQGKDVQAVEAKKLKELLPESFGKCRRSGAESQRIQQMGMDISEAEASYDPADDAGENPPHFRMKITDLGNLKGAAAWGHVAWTMGSIERETDEGWEKTTKVGSWPALEKWNTEGSSGEVQVWVAKRFLVEADGSDTTIEDLRRFAESVDLSKLAGLAQ